MLFMSGLSRSRFGSRCGMLSSRCCIMCRGRVVCIMASTFVLHFMATVVLCLWTALYLNKIECGHKQKNKYSN